MGRHLRDIDMNTPQTAESRDETTDQNTDRLPWTAPVLRIDDAGQLTLGTSNQTTDGLTNTHS